MPVPDPDLTFDGPGAIVWSYGPGHAGYVRYAEQLRADQRQILATPEGRERFVRERVGTWPDEPPQCADGGDCGCPPEAVMLCPGRDHEAHCSILSTPMPVDHPSWVVHDDDRPLSHVGVLPPSNPWIDPDDDAPAGTLPYGEVPG